MGPYDLLAEHGITVSYEGIHYLIDMLKSRGPASIRTCVLLHKEHKTEVEIDIDYLGFTIGDEWVVGYGLDFAEHDRTLPYIGLVKPDQ